MTAVSADADAGLRRVVATVLALNLGYFVVEFVVARRIGSVSLFADSIDFLEDASVNALILLALALGLAPGWRARVGMAMALLLLVPGLFTLWAAWRQFSVPLAPAAGWLGATGFGALAINFFCAWMLARFRAAAGSLTRAAWLSARNDALANLGIIGAGLATAATASHWPDLLVGLAIFALNLDAAREVYAAARREGLAASHHHAP